MISCHVHTIVGSVCDRKCGVRKLCMALSTHPLIIAHGTGTPDHITYAPRKDLAHTATPRRTEMHGQWSTCASRTTGCRRLSGSWAACRPAPPPPLASPLPQRRLLWRLPRPRAARGRCAVSDRGAGAPSDPPVVAAAVRGIIALQATPAPPRHLVRLWPQAGRQESQQAGQVDVGEAQQGHNQTGRQSTRVEKGGGMRGRAHTCSPRQSKSSLIMPYEWTASLGAAAGRSAAAWSESVVLPAQVLRPIHARCGFRSIGDARWRFAAHWVMERVYPGTQTSANQPESGAHQGAQRVYVVRSMQRRRAAAAYNCFLAGWWLRRPT